MKKTISIVLVVFLIGALAATVFAVDMQTGAIGIIGGRGQRMTDEEKAAQDAKKTELLTKYNALPDDQKALVREMVGALSPADLMTDAEKAAKKAEMEAKRSERTAALEEKYKALTTAQKAIVDEIKAIFGLPKQNLTETERQALMEKREALMAKIQALTTEEKEALREFLPMMGKGQRGGRGPMGAPQTTPEITPNA